MTEEYIDILNEQGELTGQSQSMNDVHKEGLLHRTVHVWIINGDKKLLLQKRSSDRRVFADYWDISAAGHISAGQTSIQAAQRETEEELGISLPASMFKYLFTIEERMVLNNGTYINNEFQDVYLIAVEEAPEIQLNDGEVAEVKWVSLDEFKSYISEKDFKLVPHNEEYNRLLEYIT